MPARNARPLHLNAFLHAPGHHEAAWRRPDSAGHRLLDVDYHVALARTAERGLFDAVFLADSLAVRTRPDTGAAGGLEPLTLLTALAVATERIGLIATASTTFYEPYILARTLASLDHISHGRAGWNVATGGALAEAANFNLDEPRSSRRCATSVRPSSWTWPPSCGTAGPTTPSSRTAAPDATRTRRASARWSTPDSSSRYEDR